jgi:hypothetical protein
MAAMVSLASKFLLSTWSDELELWNYWRRSVTHLDRRDRFIGHKRAEAHHRLPKVPRNRQSSPAIAPIV